MISRRLCLINRPLVEDLNSGRSIPAGGLPRRPCEKHFETFLLTGNAGKKRSARRASDRVLVNIIHQKGG